VIRVHSDRRSASQVEQRLRRGAATSVIVRVEDDSVVLDLRTVFVEQEIALAEALTDALR
jgi:hypothetical protein